MAFLSTSLGTPPMCIRGGVDYEHQVLIPDSGLYNFSSPSLNNWSTVVSLRSQNARVKGNYSLEDNFEQGYFNFENWNGGLTLSTNSQHSGYQSLLYGGEPDVANFWGIGESHIARDARNAIAGYGFNEGEYPKNITSCCVMSGVDTGVTGDYPNMKLYIGSIPSGNITIYGRVCNLNQYYEHEDKILSFDAPEGIAGDPIYDTEITTSYLFPTVATNETSIGTISWINTGNIFATDSSNAECDLSGTDTVSHYLLGTEFGFSLGISVINSIEVTINWTYGGYGAKDNSVVLFYNGSPIGVDKATDTLLPATSSDYSWTGAEIGGLTGAQASDLSFGIGVSVHQPGTGITFPYVDSIKVRISYQTYTIGPSSGGIGSGSLSLINTGYAGNRKLKWVAAGFSVPSNIELPYHKAQPFNFSNFLVSYSTSTGIGNFYASKDDEPLTLENVALLGDISTAFAGETTFYEKSYSEAGGLIVNNPKLISDFGISNRAWTSTEIREFDNARINGAYWIAEDPDETYPLPSGSDIKSLNFHFPINSSGNLGSSHSGNYKATNYYVPLSSGVNDRLFEFDRSQFNPTALTLDFWAGNTGTNPSGNIEARIDFCSRSGFFGRDFYSATHYWSGFAVNIPSGISQVRMSGRIYNSSHGLSDLSEVSKNNSNNAQLYLGVWYNNIGTTYNGDIKIYSAKVGLDGYTIPPVASSQLSLFTSGEQRSTGRMELFLQNSHVDNSFDMFIEGNAPTSGQFPLYISGGFAQSSLDLYLSGKDSQSNSFDMFIEGSTVRANMPLFIYSQPPSQASGDMSLYMYATNYSGVMKSMTLFVGENSPSGVEEAGMNLMLRGPLSARATAGMNMFLSSNIPTINNNLTLFCGNYYTQNTGNFTLFLQTKSGTLGAIPASSNMNLFLNREVESVAHNMTMYIGGPESITSGFDMSITGANKSNGEIPLYTDGIGVNNKTLKLYTHGF